MNGVILIPTLFKSYLAGPRWMAYFNLLKEKYQFPIIFTDNYNLSSNINLIITFKSPQHSNPNLIMDLRRLNKNIKLVGIFVDIHTHEKVRYQTNIIKMFERCDVILSQSYESFKQRYPQYQYKMKFFPNFFGEHSWYDLPFNKEPIMKCLIAGSTNKNYYPLRYFVNNYEDQVKIVKLIKPPDHPKQQHFTNPKFYFGRRFGEKLHSYFCCLTDCSIYQYMLGKHVEIAATGSLLLTDECEDLKKAGFIAGRHYVKVDKSNVLDIIDNCLKYPDKYLNIRKQGKEFVVQNHSIKNRFEQIKQIIGELSE